MDMKKCHNAVENSNKSMFSKLELRDRSQTLCWGPDAKKGALKIFEPCKGGPWKNYHKFSSKN